LSETGEHVLRGHGFLTHARCRGCAGERKQRIIASIIENFGLKPRLNNDRGTAILVAASIYDACHYYRLFQNTPFGKYCGIITSYEPNHNAISREPANSDERYKFDTYTQHVLETARPRKLMKMRPSGVSLRSRPTSSC
jgi:hypothetical protein